MVWEEKNRNLNKIGGSYFCSQLGVGGELKGGGLSFSSALALSFLVSACFSARCLTLLPAEGEVRKPAGAPQLHLSAAAALATERGEHRGRHL